MDVHTIPYLLYYGMVPRYLASWLKCTRHIIVEFYRVLCNRGRRLRRSSMLTSTTLTFGTTIFQCLVWEQLRHGPSPSRTVKRRNALQKMVAVKHIDWWQSTIVSFPHFCIRLMHACIGKLITSRNHDCVIKTSIAPIQEKETWTKKAFTSPKRRDQVYSRAKP